MARRIYTALAQQTGDPADRLMVAELALRAGDAADARRRYEEILAADGGSTSALRGAARAAAATGDREGALGYWRRVLEVSPEGGTAWYESRLAQVGLLADDGRRAQACALLRSSRGRARSAGADQLDARLGGMEPEVCR
jgi:tetratricopeptide (TPR) repeat protein